MVDKYGAGQDPYTYPNSSTLINHLNIKDAKLLAELEKQLSTLSLSDIEFKPPPYDFSYLCQLHEQLFSDLYSWAGKPRSISISKQDTRFCQPEFIQKESDKLFLHFKNKNFFSDLDFNRLCHEMAEFYVELNMIHPFREGNGRAQRLLFEHIAVHCGYHLNFASTPKNEWINANIIGAIQCDYTPMENIFSNSLIPISASSDSH